jgi:RND superfamily putative drug exporter
MTKALYAVGRFCCRLPWVVLAVWVVVAVGMSVAASTVGEDLTDDLTLPGTGSQQATDTLTKEFPQQANGSNPLVVRATDGKVTDSKYKNALDEVQKRLTSNPDVQSSISPLSDQGKAQISKGQHVAYFSVILSKSKTETNVDVAQSVLDDMDPAKDAGLEVAAGGLVGQKLSVPKTEVSEAVGLAAAVIILTITFGSVVAMGMPILTAILGLSIGLGIITLLSQVAEVPTIGPTLATMIGLGVGIDYALFMVTRYKSLLQDGLHPHEAISRAVATTGGAIAFAGGTVVIAVVSLAVAGIPLVTTLGYTSGIVVAIAVLAALTLLPSIVALLGHRVFAIKVPKWLHREAKDPRQSGWAKWAREVNRRPWIAVAVALMVLIPLSIPMFSMHLGQQDVGATPKSTTARQAYDNITEGFGVGYNGPLQIAVDLGSKGPSTGEQTMQKLAQALAKQKGVDTVSPPLLNQSKTAGTLNVIPTTAPSDEATADLVKHVRASTIPDALKGTGATAYVGGTTAGNVDLANQITDKLPLVIAVVIALSFILLTIAFRSLLIPIKAALMNLVSITAAYGVMVAVFQWGWGAEIIGLPGAVPVVAFVPLMMFAVLFGLSMDYEVFLMSQIKEHWDAGEDSHDSVVHGLAFSARVITSAALIMCAVFASFVLNGDPTVKQFGIGLTVAIAIDATIVRCLLVPAIMVLVGKGMWWMPKWLDKILPRINIEGQGVFDDAPPGDKKASEPEPEPANA